MTWFKVDDGFWSHPKTLNLSPNAVALWVRAGSYCGQHLTDGFVSAAILPMLQGTDDDALELVASGLWKPAQGGWEFHDWCQCQDTKEAVERRREAWKGRQRRYRSAEENGIETTHSSSIHSIPFHSPVTRDSRRDSTRESRRDTPGDKPTPTPPPLKQTLADLEALIAKEAT